MTVYVIRHGDDTAPLLTNMTPERSRATRESWKDPTARERRSKAMRDAWHQRRQSNPVTDTALRMWNTFTCPCGVECVGTVTGPRLCSNCRAERIA